LVVSSADSVSMENHPRVVGLAVAETLPALHPDTFFP